MITRGSSASGSNQPQPNIEQLDESRNIEHRKKQSPAYLRKQLSLRGWRPPTKNIKDASNDKLLLAILIQLGIHPIEGIQPGKRGRPQKIT